MKAHVLVKILVIIIAPILNGRLMYSISMISEKRRALYCLFKKVHVIKIEDKQTTLQHSTCL